MLLPACKCKISPSNGIHREFSSEPTNLIHFHFPSTIITDSKFLSQWNTAFGAPVAAAATAQAPMPQPLPISNANCDTHEAQSANYATYNHTPTVLNYSTLLPQVPNEMPQQTNFMPPHQTYITPSMWQDAVASTYGDGLKRRWDSVPTEMMGRVTKRTR